MYSQAAFMRLIDHKLQGVIDHLVAPFALFAGHPMRDRFISGEVQGIRCGACLEDDGIESYCLQRIEDETQIFHLPLGVAYGVG